MKSIEDHIAHDKEIIADPIASPAARRHAKEELHELQEYMGHHKEEIEHVHSSVDQPDHEREGKWSELGAES